MSATRDPRLARIDAFVLGHRRLVVGSGCGAALVSLAVLPLLHFDFNPMHMRSPNIESVATLLDLTRDPDQAFYMLEVVSPSLAAADRARSQVPAPSGGSQGAYVVELRTRRSSRKDRDHRRHREPPRPRPQPDRRRSRRPLTPRSSPAWMRPPQTSIGLQPPRPRRRPMHAGSRASCARSRELMHPRARLRPTC